MPRRRVLEHDGGPPGRSPRRREYRRGALEEEVGRLELLGVLRVELVRRQAVRVLKRPTEPEADRGRGWPSAEASKKREIEPVEQGKAQRMAW